MLVLDEKKALAEFPNHKFLHFILTVFDMSGCKYAKLVGLSEEPIHQQTSNVVALRITALVECRTLVMFGMLCAFVSMLPFPVPLNLYF